MQRRIFAEQPVRNSIYQDASEMGTFYDADVFNNTIDFHLSLFTCARQTKP